MVAGVGATVAGIKAGQIYHKRQAVEMKTNKLKLISAFQEKDWQEFRWYPNAAQQVKDIFEKRQKSPEKFNFYLFSINKDKQDEYFEGEDFTCFIHESEIEEGDDGRGTGFHFEDTYWFVYPKKWLEILNNPSSVEYLSVKGLVGHELQHAIDVEDAELSFLLYESTKNDIEKRLKELSFYEKIFTGKVNKLNQELRKNEVKFLEESRYFEKRADLNCSQEPEILRALATYFENYYHEVNYDNNPLFAGTNTHPHPLERARYLREKADELQAAQKLAAQKLEQEQEHYLMFSN
jgi:hypothetical protein